MLGRTVVSFCSPEGFHQTHGQFPAVGLTFAQRFIYRDSLPGLILSDVFIRKADRPLRTIRLCLGPRSQLSDRLFKATHRPQGIDNLEPVLAAPSIPQPFAALGAAGEAQGGLVVLDDPIELDKCEAPRVPVGPARQQAPELLSRFLKSQQALRRLH